MIRERTRVKAGSPIGSVPVEGTRCTFRTSWDVDVLPLVIESTALDDSRADTPTLVARLKMPEHGRAAVYNRGVVRFYLHGAYGLSSTLWLWFARHLAGVSIRTPHGETELGSASVQLPSDTSQSPLWPWHELSTEGPPAMVETLALPQRHLFVDVSGFERVPEDRRHDSLELVFRFQAPPPLPERLPRDAMRLHCVPAANVFETDAEPIARDRLRPRTLLRAAGLSAYHAEVFEVVDVTGLRAHGGGRVTYRPLDAFDRSSGVGLFRLHREHSPLDGAVDTYLEVEDAPGHRGEPVDETLSVSVRCTNRRLAAALKPGDVRHAVTGSPTVVTFQNISPVSQPVPAAIGRELQWRFVGHMAMQHRSIATRDGLRALLSLHNVPSHLDAGASRSNGLRIDGIRSVTSRPTAQVHRGGVVRGISTTVSLDEARFTGPGDAFVFGAMLDRMFASELPMNTFHSLSVELYPMRSELRWPARLGTGRLL